LSERSVSSVGTQVLDNLLAAWERDVLLGGVIISEVQIVHFGVEGLCNGDLSFSETDKPS
jgi:hypothetical protein